MNRPAQRFEPGAVVAWRLDTERGYRKVSDPSWRLVPIGDLPGRRPVFGRTRVNLSDLTPAVPGVPELRLEPSSEAGHVWLCCDERIAVREYGETVPRLAGRTVEVAYGSVVRVGPLLVAPLYAEQAESLASGAMTLSDIGPVLAAEDEDDDEAVASSRRWVLRLWGASWAASFVASAAAGIMACGVLYSSSGQHAATMPTVVVCLVGLLWFWLVLTGVPMHRTVSDWVQAPTVDPDGLGDLARRRRARILVTWYVVWMLAYAGAAVLAFQSAASCPHDFTPTLLDQALSTLGHLLPNWVLVLLAGVPIHFLVSTWASSSRKRDVAVVTLV